MRSRWAASSMVVIISSRKAYFGSVQAASWSNLWMKQAKSSCRSSWMKKLVVSSLSSRTVPASQ